MFELALRIGFSLLIVLGLMWGLARISRKKLTGGTAGVLSVMARQNVGRNSAVAVVRLVDRALVVGITDQQVTLLAETDLAALEKEMEAKPERRERVDVAVPAQPDQHFDELTDLDLAAPKGLALKNWSPKLQRTRLRRDMVTADAPTAGPLTGSIFSAQTWRGLGDFLRERTARS